MVNISCKGLELVFSDRGLLAGIFQDGRSITDKRKEDFFLRVNADGKTYTDAEDFVFEKMEQEEGALSIQYRLLDAVRITVYMEARETYIKFYASYANLPGNESVKELSDSEFCLPAVRYESTRKDWFRSPGQGACYEVTSENITFTPDSHTADMAGFVTQEDMYSTTPDKGAGLLVVEKEDGCAAVGFVPYSGRENFFPMTRVEPDGIYLLQREKLAFDITRFPEMQGGDLYLLPGSSYQEVLESYQRILKEEVGIRAPKTPEWFRHGAVLEVSMLQLKNFRAAAERIDEFYDLGVRTIYLMPCAEFDRPSMYCTMDYFHIDKEFGTEEDFRLFVQKLHEKGMRLLMDFVPQGASLNSPLVKEHPDWFEKDRDGNLFASHGWGDTRSFDWANPEVQQFFVDLGCYYVREFDVDGYRVDAPHWKEPNYDKNLPYHASNTCFGSVRLLQKLMPELTKIKPDVVLMNEVWGINFADCTHAMCEYNIHWALYNAALGIFKGGQLQRWLAAYRYTQLADSCRVVFLETHDTRLLTPVAQRLRGSAITEVLMDLAIFMGYKPMIWYEEIPRRKDYYRTVLALRESLLDELSGWADVERVRASHEDVFAAARAGSRKMLFLTNLGSYPARTTLTGAAEYFGLEEGKRYRIRVLYPEGMEVVTGTGNRFMRGVALHQSLDVFTAREMDEMIFGVQACASYWLEIVEE